MVIKAQLNLAKKLRASTTKEGALLVRGSEEDVDTSVQVRKSNGVFGINSFSNANNFFTYMFLSSPIFAT